MKKIAFVIPWFGEKIPGGAEAACRNISKHLKQKGLDVEILTTCVKEFASDWNVNYYSEGLDRINNVPVRRFKIRFRNTHAFDQINYKLINKIKITREEEKIFFKEMINSPALYNYIRKNKEKYHCFIFTPYMFGTTYYGIKECPEKSVLIPCLHDESYAYLESVKEIFELSRGIIFLSNPEKELAEKLYNIDPIKKEVIGTGIDVPLNYDSERFIKKYNLKNPFILYAGRKDKGKNVDLLLNYFKKFKLRNPEYILDLVLIGGGHIDIPVEIKEHVFDLGFVPLQDKYDAFSAAALLCQPSTHESFSIVIMESWICETPVLVNAKCEVTKSFCRQSNGGLYFNDFYEFEECIRFILDNKKIAMKLGKQGKNFVNKNFTWDVVSEKYIKFIQNLYD
ncbi:MAG: hypothetical protein PWQ82_1341 [Thermosediminibacterales bacterium]|nr:hypothetical protein [Thermosediminibacterales bacterium]MDK2835607.1 hypothetical protein [Thermosediminibacterales bacterium]